MEKEIQLKMTAEIAYDAIIEVSKMTHFGLISENKVMNKLKLSFLLSQIEIYVVAKSEFECILKINVFDKNGNVEIADTTNNVISNFENAFTLTIEDKQDEFAVNYVKIDTAKATWQAIVFIVLVIIVIYSVYTMISI